MKTDDLILKSVSVCVSQLKEKRVYDVKEIVQSVTQGARTELERLRAIWVWLCHNIGAYSVRHTRSHARSPTRNVHLHFIRNARSVAFAEYDVSGYLGQSEKVSSPEEVIAAGRGVCCGYSNLCTEMCR